MTDAHAARELKLYIDNDGDLYRRQTTSILKNLATKRARGQYKHDLAVKLFGYLVEAGARKYVEEFGTRDQPWHKLFDAATRKAVAAELARDFEAEAKLGNYDSLLPKKYQQEKPSSAHARKKLTWKTPESIKVAWSPVNQAYFALYPGRGAIKDQQVLKVASAKDMHTWLRDTYGHDYGLVASSFEQVFVEPRFRSRSHATIHHAVTAKDLREFRSFLRNATDRQVQGIYDKEKRAGRDEYAELAVEEAGRRGIDLDLTDGGYAHARRKNHKSPSQLDREIAERVPSWRWRGGR